MGVKGGVGSLHRATPGLLSSCVRPSHRRKRVVLAHVRDSKGGFFVCNLYIGQMVLAWLCWLASALLFAGLLSSAVYQQYSRRRGRAVWAQPVSTWEWYWPDEPLSSSVVGRRHKSLAEPDVEL